MNTGKLAPHMQAVSLHLTVKDLAVAVDFYEKAFGFTKRMMMPGPDGKPMHAELGHGECTIMLGPEAPERGCVAATGDKQPFDIYVYVEDVDKLYKQAIGGGAKSKMEPKDMFYGDRTCSVVDKFGFHWTFATHIKVVSEAEMKEAMKQMAKA